MKGFSKGTNGANQTRLIEVPTSTFTGSASSRAPLRLDPVKTIFLKIVGFRSVLLLKFCIKTLGLSL